MDVWVAGGDWPYSSFTYTVMVDGEVYDTITLRHGHPPLTHSQRVDIAAGYKEGLTIQRGMLESNMEA